MSDSSETSFPDEVVQLDLPDGSFVFLKATYNHKEGKYFLTCDICGRLLVHYRKSKSLDNVIRHRGQGRCRKQVKQKEVEENRRREGRAIEHLLSGAGHTKSNPQLHNDEEDRMECEARASRAQSSTPDTDDSETISQPLEIIHNQQRQVYGPPVAPLNDGEDDLSRCVGVIIKWPASVKSNYPFHLHEEQDLDWIPVAFRANGQDSELIVRPINCSAFKEHYIRMFPTCLPCTKIPNSPKLRSIQSRSQNALPHTPWKYLTLNQMRKIAQNLASENQRLRLENLRLNWMVFGLRLRVSNHERLTVLIATKNIPGLRHLVWSLIAHGNGIKSITGQLERAAREVGTTVAGRWTTRELDLAFIGKAFGGTRYLYVLSKAEGLPSDTTLRKHRPVLALKASPKEPSDEEITYNLTDFLAKITYAGVSGPKQLMVDDVALDERARYDAARNCVMGFCREHSEHFDLRIHDETSIGALKEALDDGRIHHGKEATVVAIAPVSNLEHYYPVPIALSATCKAETGEKLAEWLERIINIYFTHESGAQLHGPIYSLATDGASSFRKARFLMCMTQDLDQNSKLGKVLYPLEGLNCRMGPHGLIGTCDFKHVFKRFATLLRSRQGIKVGKVIIVPGNIEAELRKSLGPDKARQLLDPADKQNVPKAVKLIGELLKLKNQPDPQEPSTLVRRKAILFIANTLHLFIQPFTDVTASISEQVKMLSTFAHITAAMYHNFGDTFLTGALYADSQAIVKNIIFTIARLQELSHESNRNYFMSHDGTDRLENLFSHLRTQDHARNFDIQLLEQKISIATEINRIFERNPDLDRGHRRRDLVGAEGIDRVNPKSWIGNLDVGQVDLLQEWRSGREDAVKMLKDAVDLTFDFSAIFSRTRLDYDYDFLRPKGKSYVGTSLTPRDLELEECLQSSDTGDNSEPSENVQDAPNLDDMIDEELTNLENERENSEPPPTAGEPGPAVATNAHPSPTKFLVIDGKKIWKSSLVTFQLSGKNSSKSIVRTLRAQGITAEESMSRFATASTVPGSDQIDESAMSVGDPVACLAQSGDKFGLAIIEIVSFDSGGEKPNSSYRIEDLQKPGSKITVCGQPIVIQPRKVAVHGDSGSSQDTWVWNHNYIAHGKKKTSKNSDEVDEAWPAAMEPQKLIISVAGNVVLPVIRRTIHAVLTSADNVDESESTITWEMTSEHLRELMNHAWEECTANPNNAFSNDPRRIPNFVDCEDLPYRDANGAPCFVIENVPETMINKKLEGNDKVTCKICSGAVRIDAMRNHVGKHILHVFRDCEEPKAANFEEIGLDPCGWCGIDGCITTIVRGKRGGEKVLSNCPYHYERMNLAHARQYSPRAPSTNVPVTCRLCPVDATGEQPTIWKYNAWIHIATTHADPSDDLRIPFVPDDFLIDIFVSRKEEESIGIPKEATTFYRETHEIQDTSDIEEAKEQIKVGLKRALNMQDSTRPSKSAKK